jgi:hypothetical protein
VTNGKIKATLLDAEGGLEALLALGWVYDDEDSESLIVPKGRQLSMAEVWLPRVATGSSGYNWTIHL